MNVLHFQHLFFSVLCFIITCSWSRRDKRRADPFARRIFRDAVTKQARCMQWQTGRTQTRRRVILGQAWVDDRRTISNGARQRDNTGTQPIVQARYKQSPERQGKGLIQDTQARVKNARKQARL